MGAFKNIHMDQLAMNTAFEAVETDIARLVSEGLPIQAYSGAMVASALVNAGIDPYSLDLSMGELLRAVFVRRCLEGIAA